MEREATLGIEDFLFSPKLAVSWSHCNLATCRKKEDNWGRLPPHTHTHYLEGYSLTSSQSVRAGANHSAPGTGRDTTTPPPERESGMPSLSLTNHTRTWAHAEIYLNHQRAPECSFPPQFSDSFNKLDRTESRDLSPHDPSPVTDTWDCLRVLKHLLE